MVILPCQGYVFFSLSLRLETFCWINIAYAKKSWINIAYVFIHYIYSGILRTRGKPHCSGPRMTEGESVRDVLLTDLTGPQLRTDPRVSRKVLAVGCRPSPSC